MESVIVRHVVEREGIAFSTTSIFICVKELVRENLTFSVVAVSLEVPAASSDRFVIGGTSKTSHRNVEQLTALQPAELEMVDALKAGIENLILPMVPEYTGKLAGVAD